MERDPKVVLDELLVVAAQSGSSAGFGHLVRRWSPNLQRHANRLLRDPERARDVVQDAWVSIARGLQRLDDPAHFPGWAFAIVSRRCMDVLRRTVRDRRLSAVAAAEAVVAETTATSEAAEDRMDLSAAIDQLPIEQRLLISLHYGEGLGVEEIATTLRLPAGTVKSRLFAARRSLKFFMQGADDDEG